MLRVACRFVVFFERCNEDSDSLRRAYFRGIILGVVGKKRKKEKERERERERKNAIISVNMDRGASALQGNLQSSEGASFVRGRSRAVVVGSATKCERGRSRPKTAERAKRQRRA